MNEFNPEEHRLTKSEMDCFRWYHEYEAQQIPREERRGNSFDPACFYKWGYNPEGVPGEASGSGWTGGIRRLDGNQKAGSTAYKLCKSQKVQYIDGKILVNGIERKAKINGGWEI